MPGLAGAPQAATVCRATTGACRTSGIRDAEPTREQGEDGSLMPLGTRDPLSFSGVAYIDRPLNGAKPGDLPAEQLTKLEPVINLETVKAPGLTTSPSLPL